MAIQVKYRFDPNINANVVPNITGGGTQKQTDVTNSDGTITRTITFTSYPPTRLYFGNQGTESQALLEVFEYPFNSSMTSFYYLFDGCYNLTNICDNDLSSWDVSNITDMDNVFRNCRNLPELNISGWNLSNTSYRGGMFSNCYKLKRLNLSGMTLGSRTISNIFSECTLLKEIIMEDSGYADINKVIGNLLTTSTGATLYIKGVDNENSVNKSTATNRGWTVTTAAAPTSTGARFTFTTGVETMPTFNEGFEYTYEDTDNGDGTTTRSINYTVEDVLPTSISFNGCTGLISVDSLAGAPTDMSMMFCGCTSLTSVKLSALNTDNVVSMNNMFSLCENLTTIVGLDKFNTSAVTNMSNTFAGCASLTSIDVSSFNTSIVTDMSYMFYGCSNLTTLDVSSFNTDIVTNMECMFDGCAALSTLYVRNFNTDSVLDMPYMFANCTSLNSIDLTGWNVNNVRNMRYLFENCDHLEAVRLNGWHFKNDVNATGMFINCPDLIDVKMKDSDINSINKVITMLPTVDAGTLLTYPIKATEINAADANAAGWNIIDNYITIVTYSIPNTSGNNLVPSFGDFSEYEIEDTILPSGDLERSLAVTGSLPTTISFQGMAYVYTVDFIHPDILDNITDMSNMFSGCSSLKSINLSDWDVSQVTNMNKMFYSCTALTTLNVENWTTTSLTDMGYMFGSCTNLTSLDLSGWDTSKVTNMNWLFYGCNNITSINLTNFNTSNITDMAYMFQNCHKLTSINVSSFNTSKVTNMECMFNNCQALTTLIGLDKFNTSAVTNMARMFDYCMAIETIEGLSSFDTTEVTTMYCMFGNCNKLTSLDLNGFVKNKVTDIKEMFYKCRALTTINVANWDLNGVTSLYYMFYECRALETISGMNSWKNTGNISTLYATFYECKKLKLIDLSNFDNSGLTAAEYTFEYCHALEEIIGIETLITSKVTTIYRMFEECKSLKSLNLIDWDVSGLQSLMLVFYNCESLEYLDVTGWDTSGVQSLYQTFPYCKRLKYIKGIENWNTANVTTMQTAFTGCSELRELDMRNWNTDKVSNMDSIFYGCNKLKCIDFTNNKLTQMVNSGSSYIYRECENLHYVKLSDQAFHIYMGESASYLDEDANMIRFDLEGMEDVDINKIISNCLYDRSNADKRGVIKISDPYSKGTYVRAASITGVTTEGNDANLFYEEKMIDGNSTSSGYLNTNNNYGTILYPVFDTTLFPTDLSECSKIQFVCRINRDGYAGAQFNIYDKSSGTATRLVNRTLSNTATDVTIDITNNYTEFIEAVNNGMIYLEIPAKSSYTSTVFISDISVLFEGISNPSINVDAAVAKGWDVEYEYVIAEYKYLNDANYVPEMYKLENGNYVNFTNYTVTTDTATRTTKITSKELPNKIRFANKIESVSRLDLSNVKDAGEMFKDCTNLVSIANDWGIFRPENVSSMFEGCTALKTLDVSDWIGYRINNLSRVFANCPLLEVLNIDDMLPFEDVDVTNMFYGSELVDDVSLLISDSNMINNVINRLPIRSPENTGKLVVVGLYDARENVDVETAESKYWNVLFVYPIAIYTFRSDVDTFPSFNAWFTYEYTDVDNGNGTITRTIGAETFPTIIKFYQKTALRSVEFLDTRRVTTMSQMFYYSQELEYVNGDGWDTSNVTDMNQMFYHCTGLTTISNISNWDTSNVTNMGYMFNFCKKLKSIDIRDWDVSKVTTMLGMLCQCTSLTTVRMDNVDLTNVTDMTQLFDVSKKIDSVTISSNVVSINKIIELLLTRSISSPGTLNIGLFDKSEVDHASAEAKYWNVVEGALIKYKFNKSIDTMPVFNEEFNYIYKDFDNGDGTAMRKIVSSVQDELPSIISFKDKTGLIELYRINVDNVTDMSYMFANCVNLLSINGTEDWNISDVENMNNMFDNCPKLSELNFNGWSINGSTDNMLNEAEDLVKVRMMVSDHRSVNSIIDELPTRSADDIGTMIVVGSSRIESIDHAKANSKYWNVILKSAVTYKFNSYESIYPTFNEDFEYDVIDRIESETITERYIVNYDNVVPTQISFESQNNLLDVVDMNISGLNNTDGMFSECEQLTHVNFSGFNNKVENMQGMFYECSNLTLIEGLNKFDTSKVTNMGNMFYYCDKLASLDLSSFNTGAVTAMYSMFYQCTNLTSIDLSGWDTSNVTDMTGMFYNCKALTTLDVSSFNTSKVTTMINMFAGCYSLRSLNLNNFEINDDTMCVYLLAGTDLSYIKANNCGPETINALIKEVPSANYTNRRIIYNLNNTDFNNIFKKHSDSKNWKICIRRGYRKNNITIGERYL